ncbi:hypothetical protein Gotri_002810 [Gossypium trilobum]|uniref:RNase H type-1 domain-containing protein n=1 Tax=Gossypium trilobum TaxID=34281 RepID=A0A7J9F9E5_9ROSI|nr:hypothetical protein [Gossypium trilobum]
MKQYSSVSRISPYESRSYLSNWPTTSNWVCLNTDGLVWLDEGFAVDGGCVRDHKGEWIIGFARYVGNCTMLESELWGILDWLNLILDRRFENILIQTDSIETINAIMEGTSGNSNSTIVKRIHQTLKGVKQWEVQHIPKGDNLIANSLAKTVRTRKLGLRLFEDSL